MSKKLPLTSCDGLWPKSAKILCTIHISWYMHESLGQKPGRCGVSNSLFSRYKKTGLYIIHSNILLKIGNKETGQ